MNAQVVVGTHLPVVDWSEVARSIYRKLVVLVRREQTRTIYTRIE